MTALDEAMTEAQLQDAVVDALDLFGWVSFHDNDSRRNRAGFPDVCAIHPATGWLLFYELKTTKGRVRPAQEVWLDALEYASKQHGGGRKLVRLVRPADLDEVLLEIERYARS